MAYLLLVFLASWVAPAACAQDNPFYTSPNAKREFNRYLQDIEVFESEYETMLGAAAKRYVGTVDRHLTRYRSELEKEVRSLTKSGNIELATTVRGQVDLAKAWVITPPDTQGVHFLDDVNLGAVNNARVISLGQQLLAQVQQAGKAYAKQDELVFRRFVSQTNEARQSLLKVLDRVKQVEQSAGRLDAVHELMEGIAMIKALPPVQRPNPTARRRPGTKLPVYHGYFALDYSADGNEGGLPFNKLLISLTEQGGFLHFVSMADEPDKLLSIDRQPIEIIDRSDQILIVRHEFHTGGGFVVQAIELNDHGVPSSVRLWENEEDLEKNVAPVDTATVTSLGTPDARMLGLKNGYYYAKTRYTRDSFGNQVRITQVYEFQVTYGWIVLTRHYMIKPGSEWSSHHMFLLDVETKGDKLVLKSNQDIYTMQDVFEIDLSNAKMPVMRHWWKNADYENASPFDGAGPLIPRDRFEDAPPLEGDDPVR